MKNILIGLGIVASLGLSAFAIHEASNQPLGAQSVQVTDGDCYFLNGLHRCPVSIPLGTGTTTPANIKSPMATSTLAIGSCTLRTSSTSASVITLAKATTPNATTTVLGNAIALAANAQATVTASSTSANAVAQDFVFASSTYFVMGMSGGTGTFSPTGSCFAEWVY